MDGDDSCDDGRPDDAVSSKVESDGGSRRSTPQQQADGAGRHPTDDTGHFAAEKAANDGSESANAETSSGQADRPTIRLDHFLQQVGAAMTGGHAKLMIQAGEITVDGEIETRRRRKLTDGRVVGCGGGEYPVTLNDAADDA